MMQDHPAYDNVVQEVGAFLQARTQVALNRGVNLNQIVIDPGIGFGKTLEHNLELLRHLTLLHDFGLPVLLGVSRKRFIGTIGHAPEAKDRLGGSLAIALHGAAQGMHIIRVHDTRETTQALALMAALDGEV